MTVQELIDYLTEKADGDLDIPLSFTLLEGCDDTFGDDIRIIDVTIQLSKGQGLRLKGTPMLEVSFVK